MGSMKFCALAVAMAAIYPAARAADPGDSLLAQTAADPATTPPAPTPTGAATLKTVSVTAKRLDAARNELSPETGSTIYRFRQDDIDALPLGNSTPLNQVLLQAPGAAQDSFGQLHLRGDHSNLQYRINGVLIPESISGFGQALDTRFANQINILTGALPAQYGYRTAGVIDIRTQGRDAGDAGNTGSISVIGGSRGHREVSGDVGGSVAGWDYFLTGSYLHNNIGIESPTAERNALHDTTNQAKGFGLFSRVLDEKSRVSIMFGAADNRFQIPNVPGQSPSFMLDNAPPVDSAALDARQREKNSFQILSYQASPTDKLDYQIALTHRYSDVNYKPDPVGDLVFNGIAANILRKNDAFGLQGDMSYKLNPQHTLRAGVFMQRERFTVENTASVFPADDDGNQTSGVPVTIVDNTRLAGRLFGVYLQDEWKVTPALTVNYGARYDRVSSVVNEQQLSPRLGLVYDLGPRTRVHAGYARYFTPPPTEKIDTTSIAKFLNTTNALPSDANTAVSSERSHYFDVGLSHQVTPALTLGIDAYYRKVKNLQDEGQFGNALIFSAFNFEQGRIGGVELSASYRAKGLSAYANVSVSKARGRGIATGQFNFDQDELDYIAANWVHLDHEQIVSGSAGVSYQWGPTKIGADLLFGSGLRRGFANTEHLPAYTQVNASVVRTFETGSLGKVDARLAVINVFDHVYQIRDGSGIGVGAPQFGPRRGVLVGLTKYF
ncbi:MAG: TonB-dependent receptor [Gemmatimonadetes bacterium]|nr:TonB-dependent receptor [Gemmatimonadota bacterium]